MIPYRLMAVVFLAAALVYARLGRATFSIPLSLEDRSCARAARASVAGRKQFAGRADDYTHDSDRLVLVR